MNEEKQKYIKPQSEVLEMETVNPFLDNLQSGSLTNYENTDITDED